MMASRERVQQAIAHKSTDRMPFGSTTDVRAQVRTYRELTGASAKGTGR